MTESEFQEKVDEIKARYQPEIDQIERDGKTLGDEAQEPNAFEAIIDVDFTVEWKDKKLSFDVPTVTMKTQKVSFDVPEVKMKTKKISFDVPAIRMKKWCVTKVPQGWPPKMKCIYAEKPEPYMKRQVIKLDIPQISMKTKKVSFDVPEFDTKTYSFVITLPEITVKRVSVYVKELKERGDELQQRGESVAKRMEAEVQSLVNTYFGNGSSEETSVRQTVEEGYDKAISELENSIKELRANDIDPVKVPAEGGNINVRKQLADLMEQKKEALDKIDAELETAA